MIEVMSVRIPPEVRAAMLEISRRFGKQGGKKAAQNMTPEERTARAKKAADAAARKRTAQRLEKERTNKSAKRTAKK